jgi:hypothetical protein
MLRSLAFSSRWNSHYRRTFSLQRKPDIIFQQCLPPVSWFSTAEFSKTKILTAEVTKKMLVVDLKNELKKRGVSTTGKKAELLERLNELLPKEISTVVQKFHPLPEKDHHLTDKRESTTTTSARFASDIEKLDLAFKEKNCLSFEETMKAVETSIRSNPGLTVPPEEKDAIATKLRVWSGMEAVPSESIASVLKSAGYLELQYQHPELVEEIINKFLREENKSSSSVAIFLTALNKVGVKWVEMKPERKDHVHKLVNSLLQAEDLDVRSYVESLMGLAKLGLRWESLPREVRRKYVDRANAMKSVMDISSFDILVKALVSITFKSNLEQSGVQDVKSLICGLSLEGLKQTLSSNPKTPPAKVGKG